jgi:hypothetical protein
VRERERDGEREREREGERERMSLLSKSVVVLQTFSLVAAIYFPPKSFFLAHQLFSHFLRQKMNKISNLIVITAPSFWNRIF